MDAHICRTCGVQYAPATAPPAACKICLDERQYVGPQGQQWTTLAELRAAGHRNELREAEPGLTSISTQPRFAIGQRALLVRTPEGNLLWDCISYIDDETVARVRELGGVAAISVSHPHFYGSVIEWAQAFGATVYLPEADAQWTAREDPGIQRYAGAVEALPGVTIVQCGGHFEGSAVMHWRDGAEGRGALLTGDSISVVADRRWLTFMRSYPNEIPLPPAAVEHIVRAVEPYAFDRIYGGWWPSVLTAGAKEAVRRSADRYIAWTRDATWRERAERA